MSTNLGALLRQRRELRNLSLSALASLSGLAKAHIWEIEIGRQTNPKVSTICALADALNTDAGHIFAWAAMDDFNKRANRA